MKCPKCGSEHVQFATKTSGGGFSWLDSCCGLIFLGPLGLLCGAIGSGTYTSEFWVCHDCGHKFSMARGKENLQKQAKAAEEYHQNKALLSAAGNKTHSTLESELKDAKQILERANNKYDAFLNQLVNGTDRQLRRHAKVMKNTVVKTIAIIALIVGIFFTLCCLTLGPVLAVPSLVYLIIYSMRYKRAKAALAEADPEFLVLADAVKAASERYEQAKKLHRASQSVRKYEGKQ